jgi:hypothetical protein
MQVCMSLDGTRVSMVEAFFSLPNTFQRKGWCSGSHSAPAYHLASTGHGMGRNNKTLV